MVAMCQQFPDADVYKAVLLTAFFGFFRLSNLALHAIAKFDSVRHFTGEGGGDQSVKNQSVSAPSIELLHLSRFQALRCLIGV